MSSQPPLPDPAAYALQSADGSIDAALVGSKADCEFWSRADNEPQSGWQVVGIHTDASLRAYGEACAVVEREACAMLVQTQRIAMLRNEREGLAQLIRARLWAESMK